MVVEMPAPHVMELDFVVVVSMLCVTLPPPFETYIKLPESMPASVPTTSLPPSKSLSPFSEFLYVAGLPITSFKTLPLIFSNPFSSAILSYSPTSIIDILGV